VRTSARRRLAGPGDRRSQPVGAESREHLLGHVAVLARNRVSDRLEDDFRDREDSKPKAHCFKLRVPNDPVYGGSRDVIRCVKR
jgi:hypothetical protein